MATFDPAKLIVTYGGVILTGFADGEFIDIDRNNPTFNTKAGATGEVTRVRNGDRRGKVTLKLMQMADSNTYLTQAFLEDELTGATRPLVIEDLASGSSYIAAQAWIEKPAKAAFGTEATEREWVFECAVLNMGTKGVAFNTL